MGNGICEAGSWASLPDSLLLKVFQFLDHKDLVSVSAVCKRWMRVSKDDACWKRRFMIDYNCSRRALTTTLRPKLWYLEYLRVNVACPRFAAGQLRGHTDEVLHVSFSHDGSLFATCSKDCSLKLWNSEHPFELFTSKLMKDTLHWKYTQFSQFNETDTMIMVSGVHLGVNNTCGEIAVFEIDPDQGLLFRSRAINKPYDVFGCWFDAERLLCGEFSWWLNEISSSSDIYICCANPDTVSSQTPVIVPLFRFLNRNASTVRMILVSPYVSHFVHASLDIFDLYGTRQPPFPIRINELEALIADTGICTFCALHKLNAVMPQVRCECGTWTHDRLLIFSMGSETYTPHQIGFKLIRASTVERLLNAEVMSSHRLQQINNLFRRGRSIAGLIAMPGDEQPLGPALPPQRVVEADGNAMPDSIALQVFPADGMMRAEQPQRALFDVPDRMIEMHGHIIGMTLSDNGRYLFVNVRKWPTGSLISDPLEPPPIASQIELEIVDLETLSLTENKYFAHNGYTPNDQCFFIFLDACKSYVASGSEDRFSYLWDRGYGCLIAKLPHMNVVNCVAFNPVNEEMMVTVSDDRLVRVWLSKRRLQEIEDNRDKEEAAAAMEAGDDH